MSDKQVHTGGDTDTAQFEVWFKIDKDADGYPASKSWEGLWAEKAGDNYVIKSIPFYLKNVSADDTVEAIEEEFLMFRRVSSRAGHNTYRLLLSEHSQLKTDDIVNELRQMGLGVEKEIGMLLAVDVPPGADQKMVDAFLIEGKEDGRWQLQDGCLNGFNNPTN
jgi:hypothetical protein